MTCPLCFCPNWPEEALDGLKFNLESCCAKCRPIADERLKNFREPKTYVLKSEPKQFVPKQVPVKPDWNDKEPQDAGYRADGKIAPDEDVPCVDEREPGIEG